MSEENSSPSMPDLSGIMDMISKNPELVEKAASILGGLGNGDASIPSPPAGFDPSVIGSLLPGLMSGGGKADGDARGDSDDKKNDSVPALANHKHHRDRTCELLRALKPYLSKERCDAIDYMLNFSKIGDLLGTISPNGNKGGK